MYVMVAHHCKVIKSLYSIPYICFIIRLIINHIIQVFYKGWHCMVDILQLHSTTAYILTWHYYKLLLCAHFHINYCMYVQYIRKALTLNTYYKTVYLVNKWIFYFVFQFNWWRRLTSLSVNSKLNAIHHTPAHNFTRAP